MYEVHVVHTRMKGNENSDMDQPQAEGSTCPRQPRGRLLMLVIGIALWVVGAVAHNNATAITGTALSIVGFVSCGGA